ncbi:MAG: hypothetical protein H0U73_07220 [Tatlockia sp.]|nr:hypothetical protein [Tatlockia sp.]
MKGNRLERSLVVQFKCTNDESMDECIVQLNKQLLISSCELDFKNYVPSDEKMQKLALAIENNPNLERFKLTDFQNQFSFVIVERITQTLKKLSNLKSLIYRGALNANTAGYFSELIENTSSLEVLSLGGWDSEIKTLRDNDAERLAKALQLNKTLIEIDLSVNKITQIGAKAICDALKDSDYKLKILNLKSNDIESHKHEELVEILLSKDGLQTIYLEEMTFTPTIYERQIRNEGTMEQSLSLLKKNPTITSVSLTLQFKPSGDKFYVLLAKALQELSHLQELKFYGFPSLTFAVLDIINAKKIKSLTYRGIEYTGYFLNIIKKYKNLESLSLGGFHLGWGMSDSLGKQIVEALEFHTKLQDLDLSHNTINLKTAEALKKFIQVNLVLRSLNLSYNKMNEDTFQLIIDSINVNQKIHTLNLASNSCYFKKESNFLKSLEKNTRLTSLKLLEYPEVINPESSQKENGDCYNAFHLENKISYKTHLAANAVVERNLRLLKYSLYQKFILLKLLSEGTELFPFELLGKIFNLITLDSLYKNEVALFKEIKYPFTETFLAISPSDEQPENQLEKKHNELASKFANDIEISKQISRFTTELNVILQSAKALKKEEEQQIIEFAEQATNLYKSVLKKRDDVVFLKNLKRELNEFKETLPGTTNSRRFLALLCAVLTVLLAVVETLLLPFGFCFGFYQGTQYFAENCYRMFHSPLNPPLKLIDDLRKSFIIASDEISLEEGLSI